MLCVLHYNACVCSTTRIFPKTILAFSEDIAFVHLSVEMEWKIIQTSILYFPKEVILELDWANCQ